VSPGFQFGTADANVGGSAGEPSSCSSVKVNDIRSSVSRLGPDARSQPIGPGIDPNGRGAGSNFRRARTLPGSAPASPGVRLVTSDAHPGLVDAIAATLPGAAWQRCRTHFLRNLLTRVPKSAQSFVATMVRSIFAQPDAASVHEQHTRIVAQLEGRFPEAAALLDEAGHEILAFTSFPKEHWRQLWSNNSLERLNREIRRRTDVVGIFPDRTSIVRLVGALLAEQHDEWAVARRYMSAESIAKALADPVDEPEEVMAIEAAA